MAGVWERLIRSAKSIIRGLLENETQKLLSDESLYTLLCEVECIMNDRPITSNQHSLDDALALTPSMLLTFRRRCLPLPDDDFDPKELYSRRWWRRIQHLASLFWKRWTHEYVPTLLARSKWHSTRPEIKKNDIVLVADVNLPRGEWPLGRVTDLIASSDGLVRTSKFKSVEKT